MTNPQSFDEHWRLYEQMVVPGNACAGQRLETKRAFYSGAIALRTLLLDSPDDEAAEMALCDSVQDDFTRFITETLPATGGTQ